MIKNGMNPTMKIVNNIPIIMEELSMVVHLHLKSWTLKEKMKPFIDGIVMKKYANRQCMAIGNYMTIFMI
jgi:hypothetical protein